MKKSSMISKMLLMALCVFIICACAAYADTVGIIPIDEAHFPDPNFRNYILEKIDTDSDMWLCDMEIDGTYSIDVSKKGIRSLKGIEVFTKLLSLTCDNNELTEIDISCFSDLTYLRCDYNQIADIKLNAAIKALSIRNNQLTSIDLSGATALTTIDCCMNGLETLDLSKNTQLTSVNCFDNRLSTLDVSNNTLLTSLNCSQNQLISLDVSKLTALYSLSCSENSIAALDLGNCVKLTSLYCDKTGLTGLDLRCNTALTFVTCADNNLTALDVSKNIGLTELTCYNNQLTTLDISQNTGLVKLTCFGNQLTTLDISKNTRLEQLDITNNKLKSLDTGNNSALKWLSAGNNMLASLNVSGNTALETLRCDSNELTALDVSRNTKLTMIICEKNHISYIDLSNNTALNEFIGNSQTVSMKAAAIDGVYTIEFVKGLECVYFDNNSIEYDKTTGLITYAEKLESFKYSAQISDRGSWLGVCVTPVYQDAEPTPTPVPAPTPVPSKTPDKKISSIKLTAADNTMYLIKGGKITQQLTLTVDPADADVKSVKYKSSAKKIAKVDANGAVTALKVGKAKITCTVKDASGKTFKGNVTINVKKVLVKKVKLNTKSITLKVGETYKPDVTIKPDKNVFDTKLKWSSSKKKIASVSKDGLITAKKKGTAVITVKSANGKTAKIKVKVTK